MRLLETETRRHAGHLVVGDPRADEPLPTWRSGRGYVPLAATSPYVRAVDRQPQGAPTDEAGFLLWPPR